ncbi:unnamed protein product [Vitrella brassicaformis CCMP3155]|uniref:glutamate-5-semialdehyde dehydrogenase n=2 Tax=Vitrella brassicaformis TaxID=1169539 RepID=A0A0G4E8Q2_VITBC|nr:unnamed protein product [Vitrella brassicaformis CCMP3155]|mmetsp:Transcript_20322/g.49396  ORF Transcript_20322/g.49396 Transcript_20322/m.49396 type:complete len:458 (+) Transcript_20322:89-1462(+)|eukprot:CEL91764.1 unnamed protein product [Vitrella brassicaformis CCMP3155]
MNGTEGCGSGIPDIARQARAAAQQLAGLSTEAKNDALRLFKEELVKQRGLIQAANAADKREGEAAVSAGAMAPSLVKRLDCSGAKFETLLKGIDDIIGLPDPVGRCELSTQLADGLDLYRVTCPIGVLAIIFESRPEAAVQISSLALKSGNALILKGGKEAMRSNRALYDALAAALKRAPGVPATSVQLVDTREEVTSLLQCDKDIDLVIPRGSNALVRSIKDSTRIPVLGHADGLCAVYVDEECDLQQAVSIVEDSKMNYCSACNALETLLVHQKVAASFLPLLSERLAAHSVQYKADTRSLPHLSAQCTQPATQEDFHTEFLEPTMAVKVVDSAQEAIGHINAHGSHHTDCIVTSNSQTAETFLQFVDSAGVYHNASTRFADGFRYGFGAEVGISTNRIHSRGPVGLEGLVIHKYRLYGRGHVVGEVGKKYGFTHVHRDPRDTPTVDSIQTRQHP